MRRRVTVAPYIVPKGRVKSFSAPLMVPTKWVKFIVALFLLPICAILSQTFFTSFARATVSERLWAGVEFWFFSLGAVLWLIAFFGLPRPIVLYVFGHELTHALWVWLMGGRVSRFKVGREGGHILTDKNNFLIALAPYFFPLYAVMVVAFFCVGNWFWRWQPYMVWFHLLLGASYGFHLTLTWHILKSSQSDITEQGYLFSAVVIFLGNAVILLLAIPLLTGRVPVLGALRWWGEDTVLVWRFLGVRF